MGVPPIVSTIALASAIAAGSPRSPSDSWVVTGDGIIITHSRALAIAILEFISLNGWII
jgi:hypothetical protein